MGKGKHRKNQFASSHCTGESWGYLLEDASRQTKQGMGSQPQSWRLLWNKWRVGSAGSTITIMSAQTTKFLRWCRTARRSCLIKKAPLRTDVTDQVQCSWQVYFVNNGKRYLSFIDCVFNQVLPQQLNVDDVVKGRSIVVLSVWWCKGWPLWGKDIFVIYKLRNCDYNHIAVCK